MSAEPIPLTEPFDPLVELAGMWTTELAERYLPIPGAVVGKYECLDGKLIMSPYEGTSNGYGMLRLAMKIDGAAIKAGYRVYPTINMTFGPQRWIQPDAIVLKEPVKALTWVPAEKVLMPIEFVSPSSRLRDRIDKPRLCADAGIPYFMWVEVSRDDVRVELLRLEAGGYVPTAKALAGQLFETELPFPMSFDPADLLES
jgi:Uma2 family endonuclease